MKNTNIKLILLLLDKIKKNLIHYIVNHVFMLFLKNYKRIMYWMWENIPVMSIPNFIRYFVSVYCAFSRLVIFSL